LNQVDLAKDHLNQSKIRLKTAGNVINDKAYAYCVRQCQEAVELSLKAALRIVGKDFPKWHDIGVVLIKEKESYPKFFISEIDKLASISEFLASKRELAMYGDDDSKKSPSKLFNKEVAETALKDAKFCLETVEKLFEAFLKEQR